MTRTRKTRLLVAALGAGVGVAAWAVWPGVLRATSQSRPHLGHNRGKGFCADVKLLENPRGVRVNVHKVRGGSVVWQRTVNDAQILNDLRWSRDSRAVAYVEDCADYWRIVVWRAEGRPQVFASSTITDHLADGAHDISWSPDNKRIILRSFASGGLDADAGTLVCFHPLTVNIHRAARGVRRAEWIGPRQVRYWTVNGQWNVPRTGNEAHHVPGVNKPAVWRCSLPSEKTGRSPRPAE